MGLLLAVSPVGSSWAELPALFVDPEDHMLDASRYLSEQPLGFLPVPDIITEPALGTGFALGAIFFHESAEQRKQRTQKSAETGKPILPANISLGGGGATSNGTWAVAAGHLGYWRDDTVRYQGFALYADVNLDFYSLGGIELPRPVELNNAGPLVFQRLKLRMGESDWFVGAVQLYRKVDVEFANGGSLQENLPGSATSGLGDYSSRFLNSSVDTSGLGFLVEYDSVGNPFNPESGYQWSAQATWFDGAIGSDIDYWAYDLTALNYWRLPGNFLLGLRFQYDSVSAPQSERLPPYVPPYIQLRGIPVGRYQGNSVAVGEVQLGWKPAPRWTLSLFSGAGRAAGSFGDLPDASSHTTIGTGFRYLVARRYGFVMGLDVARGPEDTAFYIQAGSTWR